jgi:4-hydroxy-3-polyprenylbenzoate decarboxylase
MESKDLRSWLNYLEKNGELLRIKAQVDSDLEISEILRKSMRKRGPAVLFENIKNFEKGWCTKLFAGGLASRSRMALMFGLPKETSYQDIVKVLRKRLKEPLEPVAVETGPVKENVIKGNDVDLYKIPVPKWHALDGGLYINTWCGVVTMDPDTGERNVGTYRGMITGKNKISTLLIWSQDWGKHYAKYMQRGEPMPVAVIYGWDPSMVFTAGFPFQGDEYRIMGSIMQEPVPLVKCETSQLQVPASAEIVLEGTISTDQSSYEHEGPFGEFNGFYGGWGGIKPVINVSCITHRNDPVYRGNIEGMSKGVVSETGMCSFVAYSAAMWEVLESQGLAGGVIDLIPAPWAVIKIHKTYQGQPKQIAAALWGSKLSVFTLKTIMVVEEDVDIHELRELQLAFQSNVNPTKDLIVFPMNVSTPADISNPDESKDGITSDTQVKLLIDATVDWDTHPTRAEWGGKRLSPRCTDSPPEVAEKVNKRWKEYGFTG